MAIVNLLAHRDGEDQAEAADEILLVIAVEDDGVDQAHRLAARRRNRGARRRAATRGASLLWTPSILTDGAHRPGLLDGDLLDRAGEFGEAQDAGRRAVFERADQARRRARPRGRRWSSMSMNAPPCFGMRHWSLPVSMSMACADCVTFSGAAAAGVPGARRKGPARAGDGGEAAELDRAIGPIGQRPRLQGERLAVVGGERERLVAAYGAARPRHAPTHAGFDAGLRRRASRCRAVRSPGLRLRLPAFDC